MACDSIVRPDLKELLVPGMRIQRVPDLVRARALARARAIAAAAAATPVPLPLTRRRIWPLILAALLALAFGAAVAGAGLHSHTLDGREPVPPPRARAVRPAREAAVDSPPPSPMVERTVAAGARPRPSDRHLAAHESAYAVEIDLLSKAQIAYAGRDFGSALALIAMHARRFPNACLAEEREALRVRLLAGSGRAQEAHRAATAFAFRFPRSVLLSRLYRDSP